MNQTANYTIGIDLGDRQHTVCVLQQSGEIEQELTVRNTREELLGLAGFKGSTVVMETGTHSPCVSRYLQQMGLKVIVANARKVRNAVVRTWVNQMNSIRFLLKSLGVQVPSNCSARRSEMHIPWHVKIYQHSRKTNASMSLGLPSKIDAIRFI